MHVLLSNPAVLVAMTILIAMCFTTWPIPAEASRMPVPVQMFWIGIVYVLWTAVIMVWQGLSPVGYPVRAYGLMSASGTISLIGTFCMAALIVATMPIQKFPDYFAICLVAQIVVIVGLKLSGGAPLNVWHWVLFALSGGVALAAWKAGL